MCAYYFYVLQVSYATFVHELQLRIDFRSLDDASLARASQLSLRTNQFNTTSIRYSPAEMNAVMKQQQLQSQNKQNVRPICWLFCFVGGIVDNAADDDDDAVVVVVVADDDFCLGTSYGCS